MDIVMVLPSLDNPQIGLLTRKLRALSKLDKRPKFRPQDPDESLQIEPFVTSKTNVHAIREPIDTQDCPPPKRKKAH